MSGEREVGVGPWQGDWPKEPHYDPALLEAGDRRNVPDRYRYWRREAIIADLDAHYRNGLHVAIENIDHDFNIGSIVRTANAFGVAAFHIVGKKRWNRRGAMVTDRYQHEFHHARPEDFLQWARDNDRAVVAVDIVPGAVPLEHTRLPKNAVLVFGEEGGGVSKPLIDAAALTVAISQFGSTRSINVGHAAAIVMHTWVSQHVEIPRELTL
ncbi:MULTISPECIES: TrmH family RNA methyltransferase [Dermabacter]|uniref:TrmH family RNA methyltransferase n=1 Tax=Dermabacter TaxID=36739 RepID=UPI0008A12968|nr:MULTISPECIES: TrmH family RNA methyltransferase [unclassified Dermabacter]MCT1709241.1 TrmH family RNA methyltransferase [Dermabacter hominis]MDU4923587.1 TrmH family RNA methyltransferase [Dermabacter sp.]OFT20440.1 rRNA methyltransferase [Dermabacter sp. HMSC08H10]